MVQIHKEMFRQIDRSKLGLGRIGLAGEKEGGAQPQTRPAIGQARPINCRHCWCCCCCCCCCCQAVVVVARPREQHTTSIRIFLDRPWRTIRLSSAVNRCCVTPTHHTMKTGRPARKRIARYQPRFLVVSPPQPLLNVTTTKGAQLKRYDEQCVYKSQSTRHSVT